MSVILNLPVSGEPIRFEKISDHCYYLPSREGGDNLTVILTDEGVLVVDPPSDPVLPATLDALRNLTSRPVRWVIVTNPLSAGSSGVRFFAEQGASILAASGGRNKAALSAGFPWLFFGNEVRLFPSNIEVRAIALQRKARTGGDVFVYVPADKVVISGAMYEAARYPDIETAAQGSASEWVDGLKQVVDAIPVLRSAIPQAKAKPNPLEPEKTLEEGITVLSAKGPVSNLQNMKDLLSTAQKLRSDMSKAVKGGRTCEGYLSSGRAGAYRVYSNFDAYAAQLCEEIRD